MSQSEPKLIFNQHTSDGEVRVWQQDNRRWLDFHDGLIQSEIVIGRPDFLPLPLNQAMLAGMMFVGHPKRVLLAGTGGGATARYFASRFPDVVGDAIEKSDLIATIARDYFYFPNQNQNNWQIITADIATYTKQCQQRYDLIVIDIAVEQITPEWIVDRQFLQQCRSILMENGQVVFNLLVDDANAFLHYLSAIRDIFDRRTVCLSLPNYRNTVIMAFNQSPSFLPEDVAARLSELEALWELDFTAFYQQILKDNPRQSGVF
jgi:spermidine synthase